MMTKQTIEAPELSLSEVKDQLDGSHMERFYPINAGSGPASWQGIGLADE